MKFNANSFVSVFMLLSGIIFVFRFIRIFFVYVKTGKLGNIDNFFMNYIFDANAFDSKKEFIKLLARNFFFESHPYTIVMDTFVVIVASFVIWMLWMSGIILYIVVTTILLASIVKLAKYMRQRVVKKEKFISRLNGQ